MVLGIRSYTEYIAVWGKQNKNQKKTTDLVEEREKREKTPAKFDKLKG